MNYFIRSSSFLSNRSSLALIFCFIILGTSLYLNFLRPLQPVITYDPAGYYIILPAIFIHKDIKNMRFYDEVNRKYNIGDNQSHRVELPNGNVVMKYSLGLSILYSPGFLIANLLSPADTDGYDPIYYYALCIWALIFTCIGLFLLRKSLLIFFSQNISAILLILLVSGTNYLIYTAFNPLMAHGFLFALISFLIYLTIRWYQEPSYFTAILIGLCIGLITLVRPTALLAALIPLLWGAGHSRDPIQQVKFLSTHIKKLLVAFLAVFFIGSIQLMYWKYVTGDWFFYSYQDQGFDFLSPHIWKGFFSFKKGWLIYTPLMLFALLGFVPAFRQRQRFAWPFLFYTLTTIYVVFSWQEWWYGGSVGCRAMVESYAVLVFPLGAFLTWIKKQHAIAKSIITLLFLLFIYLNINMTYQSHAPGGGWHASYMTRAYYQKIIGRWHIEKNWRKFLDAPWSLAQKQAIQSDTLLCTSYEDTSSPFISDEKSHSGAKALVMKKGHDPKPITLPISTGLLNSKNWLRASCYIFHRDTEWNNWSQNKLYLQILQEGDVVFNRGIRLNWLADNWQWEGIEFEIPLDQVTINSQKPAKVRVFFHNYGSEIPLYIDDLCIEVIQTE